MLVAHEKRRSEPSYSVPFFFEGLELVLIWVVFGIYEATMNITQWSLLSYALSLLWLLYTIYKLKKVLHRQTRHS